MIITSTAYNTCFTSSSPITVDGSFAPRVGRFPYRLLKVSIAFSFSLISRCTLSSITSEWGNTFSEVCLLVEFPLSQLQ